MRIFLLAALILSGSLDGPQIAWQADYARAFQAAAADGKVVFLAMNMDRERANDRAAEDLYPSKEVVALSSSTLNLIGSKFEHSKSGPCPRFGVVSCAEHRQVDLEARTSIFGGVEASVIAPHHVFLDGQGKVLLSVAYEVREEELAWCFTMAQRLADPDGDFPMPPGARAPKRAVMGDVARGADGEVTRPLTEEELEETIKELNGSRRLEDRVRLVHRMIATDHPDAIEAVGRQLKNAAGLRGGGRGAERVTETQRDLIRRIGKDSPVSYWEALEDSLTAGDEGVRLEAAVALEQMAAPDACKMLKKAWKKEKAERVRCGLLRALGTCGARDSASRKVLLSAAKSSKESMRVRCNAYFALGSHPEDKNLRKLLEKNLEEGSESAIQAMVLGLAFGRNTDYADLLEAAAAQFSDDPEITELMKVAAEVHAGGNLSALRSSIVTICGDELPRERFFGPDLAND